MAQDTGDDAIYFDHSGDCRDTRYHKGCPGRWRGAVSLGYGPDGKRIRRKVGGRTKHEVKDKLEELHADLTAGIAAPDGRYTVGQAIEDWLRDDLDGRAAKTVTLYRGALKPFADHIGKKPLRELTAQDVRGVLTDLAATHSSRTVVVAHNAIERAIRHAEANDYVRRNVASLVRPHVAVWRSVRAHGDTKTEKSRRTLRLPERAVTALRAHRARQAEQRLLAGELWQDNCAL